MIYNNQNMLRRIAQADALCMATEYILEETHKKLFSNVLKFEKYYAHPIVKLLPGQYSDDTQMSIANTEVLISKELSLITPIDFANSFVAAFKRDQRPGYSKGFQKILESVSNGKDLIKILDTNSNKNGAAMRSVPFGVIPDRKEIIRLASMQAAITHNTKAGIWSAVAVALMSHFALYHTEPFSEMLSVVKNWHPVFKLLSGQFNERVIEKNPVISLADTVAIKTVDAVLTLLLTKNNLKEILEQVISWGGDTDSVAAIAWGIASARMSWPEIEPEFLNTGLELNGKFGIEYLDSLSEKLFTKF